MPKRIDDSEIIAHFVKSPRRVYTTTELGEVCEANRAKWRLPLSMSSRKFIGYLLENTKLREVTLACKAYDSLTRYAWGNRASPFYAALAIRHSGYLSHGTALWIHEFAPQSDVIYVNYEQSKKPAKDNELEQGRIHTAFRAQQRTSRLVYRFGGTDIVVISGKHSGRLGAVCTKLAGGEETDVSCPERTLIDVTVRPEYGGGVHAVLNAFRAARGHISIEKLCQMLTKLDYTYPYHQSIGFYLTRAGYAQDEVKILRRPGVSFDFYLAYGLKNPMFDVDWRIFYPQGMQ
jgi:predicted transcriptional regulator of viral defense system